MSKRAKWNRDSFWSKLLWTPKIGDRVILRYGNIQGRIVERVSYDIYCIKLKDGITNPKVFVNRFEMRDSERSS